MKHLSLLILILLFSTCKKKESPAEPIPEEPAAIDVWESRSIAFTDIVPQQNNPVCDSVTVVPSSTEPYDFTDPCVNPTNNLQVCFLRHTNTEAAGMGSDLLFLDLNTNKTKVLARAAFFRPDINSKGWVLFTAGKDYTQIFKIKLNGDSLKTLVTANSPQQAKWSPDGSQFAFYCSVCDVIKIADENGTIKKPLLAKFSSWEWKSNHELYVMKAKPGIGYKLCVYDLTSDAVTELNYVTSATEQTLYFEQSTKRLYVTGGSLYQLDENGSVVANLKSFFWHDRNRCPNTTGTWLLSQRMISEKRVNDVCKIAQRSVLSLMPASGGVERKLVIPIE
jgi:hypothetical protein